jgi:prevent-host-death family protein
MDQVKITQLRANLPKYLGRIQRGESITVVSRGKPVARLVPINGECDGAQERLAALRKRARIGDVISSVDAQWNAARDSA